MSGLLVVHLSANNIYFNRKVLCYGSKGYENVLTIQSQISQPLRNDKFIDPTHVELHTMTYEKFEVYKSPLRNLSPGSTSCNGQQLIFSLQEPAHKLPQGIRQNDIYWMKPDTQNCNEEKSVEHDEECQLIRTLHVNNH